MCSLYLSLIPCNKEQFTNEEQYQFRRGGEASVIYLKLSSSVNYNRNTLLKKEATFLKKATLEYSLLDKLAASEAVWHKEKFSTFLHSAFAKFISNIRS